MNNWALVYLSIGLAFFAWMLAYRFDKLDIAGFCEKVGIPLAQRWLIFIILAVLYAAAWPVAAPLSIISACRRT